MDELQIHIEMLVRELIHEGWSRAEARREALRQFGNVDRVHLKCSELYMVKKWRGEMLWQDIRFAIRTLQKSPGFTVVAVLTLALGIGANTAIFTMVNSVILQPLPYQDSHRLVSLWHSYENVGLLRASVSPPNYVDYTRETEIFEDVSAFTSTNMTLTGDADPTRLRVAQVTANFFQTLQAQPNVGRTLRPDEGEPGREFVAMLSNEFWQTRFGGDPQVIGQTLALDNNSYEIVGMLPPTFRFTFVSDIYVPLAFTPQQLSDNNRGREFLSVIARLQDGVDLPAAQSRMADVARRIDEIYGRGGYTIGMAYLKDDILRGNTRPALLVLLGAVGFVLLIGCANVANLLFARADARQRELAVRTALGASRARIVRQFLTESTVLGGIGGLAGLLLAIGGVQILRNLPGVSIPRADQIAIDGTVLLFTAGISLVTGLLFGLGPALGIGTQTQLDSLQEGGRRSIGGRRSALVRKALVVSEVSLALVLLIGAGLMMKSFARIAAVDPGFNPTGVLSVRVNLPTNRYSENEERVIFFANALERIRALPGVTNAGAIIPLPMSGANWSGSFQVEGVQYSEDNPTPNTKMRYVTPHYIETMGIPLRSGRTFSEFDTADNLRVAVVDETFVRRYVDGEPLGQRIGFPGNWTTIVGVVGDVQDMRLGNDINGHIYWPHAQNPIPFMAIMARTQVDPLSLSNAAIREIRALDPTQAPYDIQTMEQRVSASVAGARFGALLITLFGAVALLLAAIGIYGVLSFLVTRRTNEIGVRTALGAKPLDVMRLVLAQGMVPVAVGTGVGLLAAFGLTRLLTSLLFGVSTTDVWVFASIPGLIIAIALVACALPAWRATRVDPVEALRYE